MKFLKLTRFTRLLSKVKEVIERGEGEETPMLVELLEILAERSRLKSSVLITQIGWLSGHVNAL